VGVSLWHQAPIAELAALWVPGSHIVYIGKANARVSGKRGLRKRLNKFRQYGAGAPVGHGWSANWATR
jgi:hypothetical protein